MHVTALCPGLTKTEFQDDEQHVQLARGFPAFVWTSVESVAATGLADVAKNKTLSVPGMIYKSAVAVSDITPRFITRRVSGLQSPADMRRVRSDPRLTAASQVQ